MSKPENTPQNPSILPAEPAAMADANLDQIAGGRNAGGDLADPATALQLQRLSEGMNLTGGQSTRLIKRMGDAVDQLIVKM